MIIKSRLVEFGVRFYLFVMGQMPLIIVIVPYHYVVFCQCFIECGGAHSGSGIFIEWYSIRLQQLHLFVWSSQITQNVMNSNRSASNTIVQGPLSSLSRIWSVSSPRLSPWHALLKCTSLNSKQISKPFF